MIIILVPTWDDIIPYSINGDEKCAVVEQGEGLTFFTIEKGERQDHPRISTTWVTYNFKNSSGKLFVAWFPFILHAQDGNWFYLPTQF